MSFDALTVGSVNIGPTVNSGRFAVPGAIGQPLTPAQTALISSGSTLNVPFGMGSPDYSGPYTPAQIRHAYGFDQLSEDGTGQTIGILDAYDTPSSQVASDLNTFDSDFGLPAANLTVETPSNDANGNPPTLNPGWNLEIALDVEWAHAIAPGANILLIETATSWDSDLLNGVLSATNQGASVVSMSWGENEFSGENWDEGYFDAPGVSYVASSGDSGSFVSFPAILPNVTSVGGTTLTVDGNNNWASESAWSSGGGGLSTSIAQPSYQSAVYTAANRSSPDVAYDADYNSGVIVCMDGGLYQVGGTSVGAPQWSGLIALANQGRAALGESSVGTGQVDGTNSELYQLAGSGSTTNFNLNGDYHDITTGNNGYPATQGYDLATGLGTPVANNLVPDLILADTPGVPFVGDSRFGAVPVGTGNDEYDPTGSAWTFSGTSGVSGNDSTLTSGNPSAPQGSQVGFIEQTGSITQSISGWAAGSYKISFDAAQSGNNGTSREDFEVLVNGISVGTFKPTGTSYQTDTTSAFNISAATNTIQFVGLDSAGGNNTALLDAVSVATAPATLPSYVKAGSVATYNASTNTLNVTGPTTIIADPGTANAPYIVASGSAAQVTIEPATVGFVNLAGITLTNGASLIVPSVGAARSHTNHNVIVLDSNGSTVPTFSIDSASKLDLQDNDLIIQNGATVGGGSDGSYVAGLVAIGRNRTAGNTWTGNGLTSSVAASTDASAGYEQTLLGFAVNADLPGGAFTSWQAGGSTLTLGLNDVIVKYTYNGDFTLNGMVDANDAAIINTYYGVTGLGYYGFIFGDTDGNGTVDANDLANFDLYYGAGTGGANGARL